MNHLTPDQLRKLLENRCTAAEADTFLAHLSECEDCALLFASLTEGELVAAPASLQEDIARKIRANVTSISRREFHGYCLRVGAAVCASLILVFSGGWRLAAHPPEQTDDIPNQISQLLDQCGSTISATIEKITNWEGFCHDHPTE